MKWEEQQGNLYSNRKQDDEREFFVSYILINKMYLEDVNVRLLSRLKFIVFSHLCTIKAWT